MLLFSYLFLNPFRLSKSFLLKRGEKDIYTYGETPLTTLDKIAKICELNKQDVVLELGCGRGRACFWLQQFIGCSVIGVDYVPIFIQKAQHIVEKFQLKNITFRLEDLFQTDLKDVTVVYLYGTCFSTNDIHRLISGFKQLPKGAKVITVSYALADVQPSISFQIVKQFEASFTWGMAEVYLQIKQ